MIKSRVLAFVGLKIQMKEKSIEKIKSYKMVLNLLKLLYSFGIAKRYTAFKLAPLQQQLLKVKHFYNSGCSICLSVQNVKLF